ncbi:hypothetical protein D3C77_758230 [compost metagenome]
MVGLALGDDLVAYRLDRRGQAEDDVQVCRRQGGSCTHRGQAVDALLHGWVHGDLQGTGKKKPGVPGWLSKYHLT